MNGSAPGNKTLIATSWDIGEAADLRIQRLVDYWNDRRGDRAMPSRADINPTAIPDLLPYIALVDVSDNPRDFRIRLIGTHVQEFVRQEIIGKVIADIFPPDFYSEVRRHWTEIVERRAPKIGSGRHWAADHSHIKWEAILLPLSADGVAVNMLVGVAIFTFVSDG